MRLRINGRTRELAPAPHETLLETLRERLFLTGAKAGCERGECGACTVLLDGEPVLACLTLTAGCDEGGAVTTVEGLATGETLHPLQAAFVAHDAVQCGFCTPGQLMAAHALLRRDPAPSDAAIREAMAGNLCRCGTSPRILEAVRAVAGRGDARGDGGGGGTGDRAGQEAGRKAGQEAGEAAGSAPGSRAEAAAGVHDA